MMKLKQADVHLIAFLDALNCLKPLPTTSPLTEFCGFH